MEYILLYPDSHDHLGIFNDLKNQSNVEMFRAGFKNINSRLLRKIRRIHTNSTINHFITLPFRLNWYQKPVFQIDKNKEYCVIVLDGAMRGLSVRNLNNILSNSNVRGVLVLINSMNAQSVAILETKKKLSKIYWDDIYSFDPVDVITYGFKPLGNCYYSYHYPKTFLKHFPNESASDVYFTGGLKGGREDLILSLFEILRENGIRINFNLAVSGIRRLRTNRYSDEIHYYSGGWVPYEKVLAGVFQSRVIVEILQEGQSGPSLRYYEAVCYNKKLLTNNPRIIDLPYYDSRYMKIFNNKNDIDIDCINWIMDEIVVNYNYKGDFSPVNMLDRVLI